MTIKGLGTYLKKNIPQAIITDSINKLKGYRVAIDGNLKIYQTVSAIQTDYIQMMPNPLAEIDRDIVLKNALKVIISFIISLVNVGITPVWCFDGESLKEKIKCKAGRVSNKDKIKTKLKNMREILEQKHILLRTKEENLEYKSLLSQISYLHKTEVEFFKNAIESLGFPCLYAKYEGEKLCASLAMEGLVLGVWGNDSDNFALGTPLLITGFNDEKDKDGKKQINIIDLRIILDHLKISHKLFLEVCILSGCDFNENIPSYGFSKNLGFIKKHGSIEPCIENNVFKINKTIKKELEKLGEDDNNINFFIEKLNYNKCREIFSKEDSGYNEESSELNFNYDLLKSNLEEVSENNNLGYIQTSLFDSVKNILEKPKTKIIVVEKKSRLLKN